MGWHQGDMGAMVYFTTGTDYRDLVTKIAMHVVPAKGLAHPEEYKDNDVQVLECVVLLGHGDIVCRVHAPRRPEREKGGAERIADWVNSVINDPEISPHIKDSRTYAVGYEVVGRGGARAG